MKRIGITQRVENIQNYSERRDCLDQSWSSFAIELGYFPIPLPNTISDNITLLFDTLNLDVILLSGGNSIACLNSSAIDIAPERDRFESALIDEALRRNIPIVGICRGMQMINHYFGGTLVPIQNHTAVYHAITPLNKIYELPEQVNSYHNWGIDAESLANEFDVVAIDEDGNIEAFIHNKKQILGIMWHPEREKPFNEIDIQLIKKFL